MKKLFRFWAVALAALMFAGLLAACGDNTATTAPAATTAAAGATTAAASATTAAAAGATTAAATKAATTAAAGATTAAAAGATTAAAATGATSGTIRIYSSLPMTGSSKQQTDTLVNAMKLALEDFTGGTNKVGNFTIEYVPLDDATAAKGQWDADQEKSNANKAANDPDAMVYIGTFNSGAAKVAIPILNQANLVMISPANTLPCLTRFDAASGCDKSEPTTYYPTGVRNYFRVITADDVQGPAAAEYLATTLKAKKVYVIDDSQAYGKGLADATASACKNVNIDCSQRASIGGKESDYKSLAAQVKAANPDAIYFGGITQQQGGKLLADIRAAGVKAPFMGGDGINEDAFIKDAGAAAEGAYSTIGGVPDDKLPAKGQDFLKRYQAKYGALEAYTKYGYEAMSVALTAIKNAGVKDRKAILQSVASTKDFDGVLGKWSFDKNGDTSITDYTVYTVADGKWKIIGSVKPKVNIGG